MILPLERTRPPDIVPLTDVLAAFSFALDLTEGQPMGHSLRANLISMELAARLDLPLSVRRDLYYAALLKDAGCSSNAAAVFDMFGGDDIAAKRARMVTNWSNDLQAALYALEHAAPGASWFERAKRVATLAKLGPRSAARLVQVRCDRGAEIVTQLGFGPTPCAHWRSTGTGTGIRSGCGVSRSRSRLECSGWRRSSRCSVPAAGRTPDWHWCVAAAASGSTPAWSRHAVGSSHCSHAGRS